MRGAHVAATAQHAPRCARRQNCNLAATTKGAARAPFVMQSLCTVTRPRSYCAARVRLTRMVSLSPTSRCVPFMRFQASQVGHRDVVGVGDGVQRLAALDAMGRDADVILFVGRGGGPAGHDGLGLALRLGGARTAGEQRGRRRARNEQALAGVHGGALRDAVGLGEVGARDAELPGNQGQRLTAADGVELQAPSVRSARPRPAGPTTAARCPAGTFTS